ncbi:MAG: hypothetical protein ACD_73C00700G0005, partial [uncultured bacterium]
MSTTDSASSHKINYLESVGMSIDAWIELTPEQKKAKLESTFKGKSTEENQKKLNELAQDLKSEKEDLKELETKLRKQLRRTSGSSDSQKAEAAKYLNKLDEISDELKDFNHLASEIATDEKKHHIDVPEGGMNISDASLKLDGQTYTYKMGSAEKNPFGEDAAKNIFEGYTSDGTENGQVIKDADGVEGMNYSDIEFIKKRAKLEEFNKAQKIFINTSDDCKWTLASYEDGKPTFKVTNAKGETSYVTFENAENVVFVFKAGISEKDLNDIKSKWPPELLEKCYWDNDEKSFAERLGTSPDSKEVASKDRLGAIAGYDTIRAAYDKAFDQFSIGPANSKEKCKKLYEKAIDDFYGILDGSESNKDELISKKWSSLAAEWKKAGLSNDEITNMMRVLVLSITQNDKSHAELFVAHSVTAIETTLNEIGGNQKPVIALMLYLETEIGAGLYGGDSALENMDSLPNKLSANEKLEVMGELKQIYTQTNQSPPASFNEQNKIIIENMTTEEKIEATGGYNQMSEAQADKLLSACNDYGKEYAADVSDGIYEEELAGNLGAMVQMIYNGGKKTSVAGLRNAILDFLMPSADKLVDELAATFLQLLHDKDPALFNKLLEDKNFCDKLWGMVDNGGNDPENYYQCREWLTGRDFVDAPIFDDTINGALDTAEDWGDEVPVFGHAAGFVAGGIGGLATDV